MNAPSASVAVDPPGSGAPPSPANPIIAALHDMAVTVLSEQLREMFDRADDILFDSAEKARASDEQRVYMDTMRSLRIQRGQIIDSFQNAFKQALSSVQDHAEKDEGPTDMSQWSLEDGNALEERLAVSGMQDKAATHHALELGELRRRLARLASVSGGQVSEEAMSPARIIQSFQGSIRDLPLDFPIKLVIYKLFDRVVLSRFSEVLHGANHLLAVNGIEPNEGSPVNARAGHSAHRRAARAAGHADGDASSAIAGAAPAWAAALNAETVSGFASHYQLMGPAAAMAAARWGGQGAGQGRVDDAILAQQISNILMSYRNGQRPSSELEWLSPESVALVARMFDGYYRDPRMPQHAKPVLGRLQMPVMKAALADPRFFEDKQHPARRVLTDLLEMVMGYAERTDGERGAIPEDLQALIESVAESFDLDTALIQAAPRATITDQAADSFLDDQQVLHEGKRKLQIERVRRIVAHEVRRRLGARELAAPLMRLFVSGFGPMLTVDYLRGGIGGAGWSETMVLLDRTLATLEPYRGGEGPQHRQNEEAALVSAITHRLAKIGFTEERTAEIISGLLSHYLHAAEMLHAGTMPAAAPAAVHVADTLPPEKELQGLLSILLVPDTWYTLLDAQAARHWVRVKNYYPAQNTILFTHYMEPRFVRMRATSFAAGLVDGHAGAIDPSDELRAAAARIAHIEFPRTLDPIVWTGIDGKPVQDPVQNTTNLPPITD